MPQVITGGPELFDSIIYGGNAHPDTQQFLSNQAYGFSDVLTEAGQRFLESAKDVYERVSGSHAARVARAAGRHVRSLWQTDEIRELVDLEELQHAPLTMQRWIMAEPTVRSLFHKQQCDGYSDTYEDMHPGMIGEDHYDWRRAMNGVVVPVDDEELDYDWYATTYMEELLPEDNELTLEEQVDIHTTWSHVVSYIRAKGSDPTSKYDSEL